MYTPPKTIRTNYAARPKARYGVKPSPYHAAKSQDAGEPEVCDTIRRNIEDDSGLIREFEARIKENNSLIIRAKSRIRQHRKHKADLRDFENVMPQIFAIPRKRMEVPRKWRGIVQLIEYAANAGEAFGVLSAARQALAVRAARRELDERIRSEQAKIHALEQKIRETQGLLDDRVNWVRQHYDAFEQHGCSGGPSRFFRSSPRRGRAV